MLVNITIKNYLSFKEETTFSMLADNKTKNLKENTFKKGKYNLLKTSAIYGPNDSGNTNLLKSIYFIRELILESYKYGPYKNINNFFPSIFYQPAEFEINFYIENTLYNYYFKVNQYEVEKERLKAYKSQKPSTLFTRDKENGIVIKNFNDNNSVKRVKENNLALSVFADENSEEAKKIYKFFTEIGVYFEIHENFLIEELKSKKIVFLNECKNSLHPVFLKEIIEQIHEDTNGNTQFIFNTHNVVLMNRGLFRRDQIWFTEKDKYGATDLYSLIEFKADNRARKENDIETNYLKGRFGAIPFVDEIFLS